MISVMFVELDISDIGDVLCQRRICVGDMNDTPQRIIVPVPQMLDILFSWLGGLWILFRYFSDTFQLIDTLFSRRGLKGGELDAALNHKRDPL